MTSQENANPTSANPIRRDPRTVGLIAGFAVIAVMAGLFWLELPGSSGKSPATDSIGPTEAPTTTDDNPASPRATAPDGGKLKITESGFTPMTDLSGSPMVSWGAIVENTSSQAVAWSQVYIEPFAKDGKPLAEENDWDVGVGVFGLLPGESVGVGSTSYIDDGKVSKLDISVGRTDWYPVGGSPLPAGTLTADDVKVGWEGAGETANYWSEDGISFPVNERGTMVLSFRVESGFDVLLTSPSATAIYRDKDGQIIGASRPSDFELFGDFPPGWSIREIEVDYGPPEELDDGTIEVYPQSHGG